MKGRSKSLEFTDREGHDFGRAVSATESSALAAEVIGACEQRPPRQVVLRRDTIYFRSKHSSEVDVVPVWLLVQAELRFSENLRPIFPRDYRPDLLAEGTDIYYGVHFVSAPAKVNPGDQVVVELVFRGFPKDACAAFQAGKSVLLKEGPLTRAEGTITRRWEHESASRTLTELQQELAATKSNP